MALLSPPTMTGGKMRDAHGKSVLVVMPVFRRFALTKIILKNYAEWTIPNALRDHGVRVGVAVIGDDANIPEAQAYGFHTKISPNVLGAKYNDGHQMAVELGYDFSLQANSDQVHHSQLFRDIAESPNDAMIRTTWMTFVHGSGKTSLAFQNPEWAMKAYPTDLLRTVPRPCEEHIMEKCDRSTHLGVGERHPDAPEHTVNSYGPTQSIQFESGFQITAWRHWLRAASATGQGPFTVPWSSIAQGYGADLMVAMKEFYSL